MVRFVCQSKIQCYPLSQIYTLLIRKFFFIKAIDPILKMLELVNLAKSEAR